MVKFNQCELAIYVAENSFKNKVDKAGLPYFNHCDRVAVGIRISDDTVLAAAYLHDILEDCHQWNKESLSDLFSDEVVSIVVCLTKTKGENYDDYIRRLSKNRKAVCIKLSDLRDNMDMNRLTEITEKDIERLKKYHRAYKFLSDLM